MPFIVLFIFSILLFACNNAGKTSVEKADSANKAKLDSGLNQNQVVIDENSSAFIVRASALVKEIGIVTEQYRGDASNQTIGDFVHKIADNQKILSDSVTALAIRKTIVLPVDSTAGLAEINQFSDRGSMGDKAIISYLIKAHGKAVSLFENAVLDAKDPEIRSFADKTVPLLRTHLESAKELEKKL